MSKIIDYAKSELKVIDTDGDIYQHKANKDVMDIVELFAKQGHSGFSAGYVLSVLDRLLRFKPITPLTGKDEEWKQVDDESYQNVRCSSVFKRNGICYDIDEYIFTDDGGLNWYCASGNVKPLTELEFPYLPSPFPKKVYVREIADGKFEDITNDPEAIETLKGEKINESMA